MPLAVLQAKRNSFPKSYCEEIHAFLEQPSNKLKASSSSTQTKTKVIFGLAAGKWKYPNDINAFDDDIENGFEDYL